MRNIRFDYDALLEKINVRFGSVLLFSLCNSISDSDWIDVMSGKMFFEQSQIEEICLLLAIDGQEVGEYFFKEKIKFS